MKLKNFFRLSSHAIFVLILIAIAFGLQPPAGVFADVTDPGTGPGGVESLSNTSNLVLWLDANDIGVNDGDAISTWNDKSGFANNATQSDLNLYPTLQTAELNGQSVVRFDGINDVLKIQDDDSLDNTSGLTIFTVINPMSIDYQVRGVLSKRVDYQDNASYSLFFYNGICTNPNCLTVDINNNSSPDNRFTSDPYTYTVNVPSQIAVIYDGTATSAELFSDASSIATSVTLSPTIPNYASDLAIGSINIGYTTVYSGDIAEAIIFRKALNTAEHTLVENYLSSKYNIDISTSGLDRYDGDTAAKDEYDLNVAGIGLETDGSNLNASSVGLFLTDNNFLVDNGDYALFGHGSLNNAFTTDNVPSGIAGRWSRDWYFDITDISTNGGTVDLTFDFSDSGVTGPTGDASNYKLLSRTATGDTFSILSYSATLSGDQVTFSGVPSADLESHYLTLGAVSLSPVFTVTFDANGGTGTMSPQTANVPTALTPNTFTLTGYSFTGWNTQAGGGGTAYADGAVYDFDANITLFAQWSALPNHTVTFDANGGTGTMSPQTTNVPTALTPNTFTLTGYSFTGWNTQAGGGGTAYADGAVYDFDADITLFAQWSDLPSHTVTFDANGGTGTMSPQTANVPTALTPNTFTLTGYSFTGWNTQAGGGGTAFADGAVYDFDADITLFAQWSDLPSHTVTFDANGGTGTMSPQTANVPTALTLNTFTQTGYSFSGWNTETGGGGTAYADGAVYDFDADITLFAQWSALPNHTVTFDANGGTGTMSPQITNVPTALTLNTFTRTGYSFTGWNTQAGGGGTAYADGAVYDFDADITLFAQWATSNTYTLLVTKDGNGSGSVTSTPTGIDCGSDCSEDYMYNTVVTLTAVADTGSSFTGWSGGGCSGIVDCVVTMDAAKSITATFKKYSIFIPLVFGDNSNPSSNFETSTLSP